jgi:PAS domain S-box-containing protein
MHLKPEPSLAGSETPNDAALAFLQEGGEMGALIRAHDWSSSSLGPPETWAQSLQSVLSVCLNAATISAIYWGPNFHVLYNDAYAPALAERHPAALGEPLRAVWPEIFDILEPQLQSVCRTGRGFSVDRQPLIMHRRGRSEETFWFYSFAPIRGEGGEVAGVFVDAMDITDQIVAENALKESEAKLRALNASLEKQVEERTASLRLHEEIIQSDSAPICAFDTNYRLTAFNQAQSNEFFRLYGYRVQIGDNFPSLFSDNEATLIKGFMTRALAGETFTVIEEFGDPKSAKLYWEIAYSPIRKREGQVVGAFHHARDVTKRLQAEAELITAQDAMRQAQKMEAVGQLTGGVAHDFNNLLTVIRGSVELLRRPNLSTERRTRYVDAIGDTADRASKLTAQLLAFSRRQSLKPEIFDVVQSVDQVANIVRTLTGSRIELEVVRPRIALAVNTDRSQFDTTIVNMAVNARDAMGGEGRLAIRTGAVSNIPARRGHAQVMGDFVAVALTDTGSGIAEEDIARVFEPFFTTKGVGHGTGLGLSQVIGFAKQSGGDVHVESVVGEGTTFTLYLPRVYAELEQPITAPEETVSGEGVCVLVVEDNDSVGQFATEALHELGYDSILARDAQQALAELSKKSDRFHVVFSDVVMPGMSGLDLGELVRRDYPDIPVILTSGYSHVLAQNGQHGFELLHKPYSIEQLSRVLLKAIGWHRAIKKKVD